MVKRVRAVAEGAVSYLTEPSWVGKADQFSLYEQLEKGLTPNRIPLDESPETKSGDKEFDFIHFVSSHLVAGPTVHTLLTKLLESSCSRIELVSPEHIYNAYLPKVFFDAFDGEKSVFERFPHDQSRISNLRHIVLRHNAIGESPVFKVSGDRACRAPTFVSEEFFDLYTKVGATGLIFYDVELS